MELEHPAATILGKKDIALGVRGDAVNLVEFTRKLPDPAERRHHLAGLAVDDFLLRDATESVCQIFVTFLLVTGTTFKAAPPKGQVKSGGMNLIGKCSILFESAATFSKVP
jgi:hypothetical protein